VNVRATGSLIINGLVAIDANAVARQTYYAP
jgi:hypothetical protein